MTTLTVPPVTIFADGTRAASGSPGGAIYIWRIPRF